MDTVGALCVDSNGVVASGASSGGVSLKHEGRVGQAASFGSGVWAVMSRDGLKPSVASCTSGCGEHLIRTQLAKNSAESLLDSSPVLGLDKCLKDNFLESPFLWIIPLPTSSGINAWVYACDFFFSKVVMIFHMDIHIVSNSKSLSLPVIMKKIN